MGFGQPGASFAIRLPRCETSVERGRLALVEYLEPFVLDARVINRIEVVLEELVSNAVRHATLADSLSIAAEYSGETISLAVENDGPPFNPLEVAERDAFTDLEEAPLGGLGIPLIKRLSRSVRYDRVGGNNRVTAEIAVV